MDTSAERRHLHEVLKDFDTAMLITRTPEGHLHARPMAVAQLEPDADTYFATALDSAKTAEIEANPEVALTFQGPKSFAGVSGRATIVRDRALVEKLWKETWKVWFPEGKDDPNLALIRFDAQDGEYWDNSGSRGVKYLFEATRAYVRGERPQTGREQHGRAHV